jgi:tetratricopeptide (TPR) repeat protein
MRKAAHGWAIGVALAAAVAGSPAAASVESELAFHRGVVAYGEGRYAEARADFEKVLAEDPRDTAAIHYLGLITLAQDDPGGAIAIFERGLGIEPDNKDLRFDLGTAQLEAGQLEAAAATLDQVIAAEPDRAKAHLFRGIADYRLGRYRESIERMDRAIALDPSLRLHARYYMGLAESVQGNFASAEGAFQEVEQQSPQHPLAKSAQSVRTRTRAARPARSWALSITAGAEWDSNPLLAGENIERHEDERAIARISASYRLVDRERVAVVAGYDGYVSFHDDRQQVDFLTQIGWLSSSYELDPVRFGLRYDYAYSWIDLSRSFRSLHRVTPSVSVREGRFGLTQLFYQYQTMDFQGRIFTNALDRDGEQYSLGVNQFILLPPPFRYVRIGGLWDRFEPQGDEFRYSGWEASTGLSASLPFGVELTSLFEHIERDYRHHSVFENTRREDSVERVSFELLKPLTEHWDVSVNGTLTWNVSTVSVYDYKRFVAGGYVTYRF